MLLLIICSFLATFMLVKSLFFLKHRKFLLISCWKMWLADQCLTWQQLNKLQERLCIVMICPSTQVSFSGKKNRGKVTAHGSVGGCLRGCPHLVIGNQCLGTGTKWCHVHTLSTRYVTVYIVIPFRPVRCHFET